MQHKSWLGGGGGENHALVLSYTCMWFPVPLLLFARNNLLLPNITILGNMSISQVSIVMFLSFVY